VAGYIKIHRKLKEWEWYGDTNTMRVFLHLLLSANWKETRFKNEKIGRGECVTSLANLSNDLGLTQSQIRTALNHMEMTNTITNRRFSNYRIIKVENFDLYQANDIPEDRPLSKDSADLSTDVQQTCDESLATALATSKEYKNLRSKEVKKEEVKTYRSLVDEYTPDLTLRKALDDFVGMRKVMKGFTVRALELALKNLDKLAQDDQTKIMIVNQTIERGWKTFYPLKQKSTYTSHRQDVLPDYYQQMKSGSEKETAEETDFDRKEFEEIRRKLKEQEK
jgi:hypothetical protein